MPHYFDDGELKSLLTVAYDRNRLHHLAMLTTLSHGLRVSELLALTTDDLVGGYLRIVGKKDGLVALQPLHKSDSPVFDEARVLPAHAHGVRISGKTRLFDMSRQRLDTIIKAYGKSANVHPDKCHAHSLRHTTAMLVFRETISLGSVKNMLRHKSWDSSLVYLNEIDNTKGIAGRDHALIAIAAGAAG